MGHDHKATAISEQQVEFQEEFSKIYTWNNDGFGPVFICGMNCRMSCWIIKDSSNYNLKIQSIWKILRNKEYKQFKTTMGEKNDD